MVAATIIFCLAFLLRLVGSNWGLPNESRNYSLHPDEFPNLAFSRAIEPSQGKFTPGFYNYGTLYFTTLRIASDVVLTYAGKEGQNGNLTPSDTRKIHAVGRFLNVLFGSLVPLVAFLLLRRYGDLWGACFGSLMLAVAPALIVHSRFQTVDMLALVTTVASLYCACRVLDEDSNWKREMMISSLMAGLSAGTKYTGVLALIPLFLALGIRLRHGAWIPAIIATLTCVGAFILSTPGSILETPKFLQDVAFEMDHTKTGHGFVFAATSPAFIYHVGNTWLGFGFIAALFGVVGLGLAAWEKKHWAWVLILFAALYLIVIARAEIKFMRYVLPMFFPLGVGFGYFITWCRNHPTSWKLPQVGVAIGILGVGGLDRGGLNGAIGFTAAMVATDARDQAGEYLRQHGAGKSVGLVSDPWFWSPTIYPDMDAPRFMGPNRLNAIRLGAQNPLVFRYIPPEGIEARFDWDVRRDLKPDYISFTSFEFAHLDRLKTAKKRSDLESLVLSRYEEFLGELGKQYVLDKIYNPAPVALVEDMEYVRPQVYIWKHK